MSLLTVKALLGPDGALAAILPSYEARPEQLKMAQAVEQCFKEHRYLLAEAGTGTGKTFAYLIPAVLSGRKVVVSTATKALQEQIFYKDIPVLRDQVGLKFEAAYLKGRANYLCLHRFNHFSQFPDFASRGEAALWPRLQEWAMRTETGDRAELDMPESFSAWPELTATSESCLGQTCPDYEPCFSTRMRRRADQADLLVVNHHLFFADLALRTAPGSRGEGVLPRYEVVIFDEAHALEEVATEYLGYQLSNWRLEDLVSDIQRALSVAEGHRSLLSTLAFKLKSDEEALFRALPGALGLAEGDGTARLNAQMLAPLDAPIGSVVEDLSALASVTSRSEQPELVALCRRCTDLAGELQFVRKAESPDHAYWAERRGRGLLLRAAPIDIGLELQRRLYGGVDTLIFTSATLTAEGSFDYFARRMGLVDAQEAEAALVKVAVDSPFDYQVQAALYLPSHLPEPNSPSFVEAVAEEIIRLARLTGGRAFALFTSLRNMEQAHRLAKSRLPFQVLLQGERPKSTLLEMFKRQPSVLFAAHSFWEGIDVPGDALSLVVIDRLPFASPGDPLVSARVDQLRQRGEEPFTGYQLPQAVIALRQGFGRLIRTQRDHGIVALLDRRVKTRSYGQTFLRSLPPARQFSEFISLANFVGSKWGTQWAEPVACGSESGVAAAKQSQLFSND
jgi:ATP-dependent DNA helicase DinG